jgi:microcystin-dependent protein
MSQIDIRRTYADTVTLFAADLDAILDDVESFLNSTKLNDDNIQDAGITASTKIIDSTITTAKIATNAITTVKITDANVTRLKLEAVERTPVGAVLAYAGTSAPTGWLLCEGAAVSRVTYATLFGIIGVTHGQGNGTTTFNVPDYKGMFLRGRANSSANDPDRATRVAMATGGVTGDNVGSTQGSAYASHFHSIVDPGHKHQQDGAAYGVATGSDAAGRVWNTGDTDDTTTNTTGITGTDTSGANETRPINAYVQYIIKY